MLAVQGDTAVKDAMKKLMLKRKLEALISSSLMLVKGLQRISAWIPLLMNTN